MKPSIGSFLDWFSTRRRDAIPIDVTVSTAPTDGPIQTYLEVSGLLAGLETFEQFVTLLDDEPWLVRDETLAAITEASDMPEFADFIRSRREILDAARTNRGHAWDLYSEWLRDFNRFGAEMNRTVVREIDRLTAARPWDEVVTLTADHLPEAERLGRGIDVGHLRSVLGKALIRTSSGSHADNLEVAGPLLLSAAELAPDDTSRADTLIALAYAHDKRVKGDPRENVERAYQVLRRILSELDLSADPHLRTMAQNNIAEVLLRRAEGNPVDNLREAERHCRDALRWRTRKNHLADWAYTTFNLAVVRERLSRLGHSDITRARRGYADVIAETEGLADAPFLPAHAHVGLAGTMSDPADGLGRAFDPGLLLDARAHLVVHPAS